LLLAFVPTLRSKASTQTDETNIYRRRKKEIGDNEIEREGERERAIRRTPAKY
jgi:hypothetical protein